MVDSLKATFKRRPGNKHIYTICMILLMLSMLIIAALIFFSSIYMILFSVMDMAMFCDYYCEYMYTKRMFQWEVDDYSYYSMILSLATNIGGFSTMPLFHHFNVHDNIIILVGMVSNMTARTIKPLAKTKNVFFISWACCCSSVFYAPVRAQISRCVSAEELGKVERFAVQNCKK